MVKNRIVPFCFQYAIDKSRIMKKMVKKESVSFPKLLQGFLLFLLITCSLTIPGSVFGGETENSFTNQEWLDEQQELFEGVLPQDNPYVAQLRSLTARAEQIANETVRVVMAETHSLVIRHDNLCEQRARLLYSEQPNYQQIHRLDNQISALERQIDQIGEQTWQRLQMELNRIQAMIPQVLGMIQSAQAWQSQPRKFQQFKQFRKKFEQALAEDIPSPAAEQASIPKIEQPQDGWTDPNVVDLRDRESDAPRLLRPASTEEGAGEVSDSPPVTLTGKGAEEPVYRLDKSELEKLRQAKKWVGGKALDWLKDMAFDQIAGKIPGLAKGKDLYEKYKNIFDKLNGQNQKVLINVFIAAHEVAKEMVFGTGDVDIVESLTDRGGRGCLETSEGLIEDYFKK